LAGEDISHILSLVKGERDLPTVIRLYVKEVEQLKTAAIGDLPFEGRIAVVAQRLTELIENVIMLKKMKLIDDEGLSKVLGDIEGLFEKDAFQGMDELVGDELNNRIVDMAGNFIENCYNQSVQGTMSDHKYVMLDLRIQKMIAESNTCAQEIIHKNMPKYCDVNALESILTKLIKFMVEESQQQADMILRRITLLNEVEIAELINECLGIDIKRSDEYVLSEGWGGRIQKVINAKGMSQIQVAELMGGVGRGAISNWIREEFRMSEDKGRRFADVMNVPLEYITRGENEPDWSKIEKVYSLSPGWGQRIKKAIVEQDMKYSQVAAVMGVSTVAITKWVSESNTIKENNLKKFVEVMNVPVEYIMHGDNEPDWPALKEERAKFKKGWGRRITIARTAKCLTSKDAGKLIGVWGINMAHWETEKFKPTDDNLKSMEEKLDVPHEYITKGNNATEKLIIAELCLELVAEWGKRIRRARVANDLSRAELGEIVSVSENELTTWENETRRPNVDDFINLCSGLGVSVEYLTKGKDAPDFDKIKAEQRKFKPGYGDRLYRARDARHLFQEELAELIGATAGSIWAWETKKNPPSDEYLPKLAEHLWISIEYITDGTDEPNFKKIEQKSTGLKPGWGARIKRAREAKGLSQRALGEKIDGVSGSTICGWEDEKWPPSDDEWIKMAKVLDVYPAYLKTGHETPKWIREHEQRFMLEKGWGARIKKVREAKGYDQEDLGNLVGVFKGTVGSWELEKKTPGNEHFESLATHLSVPLEYTTKGTNEPEWVEKEIAEWKLEPGWGGRIRKVREKRKLSQPDLAKKVGVSRASIHLWEYEKNVPSKDNLKKLSRRLRVSLEYIKNGSQEPDWELIAQEEKRLVKGWGERMSDSREEDYLSQSTVAQVAGVSPGTISRWENEEAAPIDVHVQKVAEAVGTTFDYIAKGILPGVREVLYKRFSNRFAGLIENHTAFDDRERPKHLILYADDLVKNAIMYDLGDTMREMAKEGGVLHGGKIILYTKTKGKRGKVAKLADHLRLLSSDLGVVVVTQEDVMAGDNMKIRKATDEIDALIRYLSRTDIDGDRQVDVKSEDVLGIIRGNGLSWTSLYANYKHKIPLIIMNTNVKGIFSFAEAVGLALKLSGENTANVKPSKWINQLQHIRVPEELREEYERYRNEILSMA